MISLLCSGSTGYSHFQLAIFSFNWLFALSTGYFQVQLAILWFDWWLSDWIGDYQVDELACCFIVTVTEINDQICISLNVYNNSTVYSSFYCSTNSFYERVDESTPDAINL